MKYPNDKPSNAAQRGPDQRADDAASFSPRRNRPAARTALRRLAGLRLLKHRLARLRPPRRSAGSSAGIASKSTSSSSNSVSAAGPNDMLGSISTVAPLSRNERHIGQIERRPGRRRLLRHLVALRRLIGQSSSSASCRCGGINSASVRTVGLRRRRIDRPARRFRQSIRRLRFRRRLLRDFSMSSSSDGNSGTVFAVSEQRSGSSLGDFPYGRGFEMLSSASSLASRAAAACSFPAPSPFAAISASIRALISSTTSDSRVSVRRRQSLRFQRLLDATSSTMPLLGGIGSAGCRRRDAAPLPESRAAPPGRDQTPWRTSDTRPVRQARCHREPRVADNNADRWLPKPWRGELRWGRAHRTQSYAAHLLRPDPAACFRSLRRSAERRERQIGKNPAKRPKEFAARASRTARKVYFVGPATARKCQPEVDLRNPYSGPNLP